ncbi:MAG: hypothetical protein JW821_02980 [Deltaproteobacteria bacterium]|nr:hypothetical protein [Deltaproteobacteria bacterium]
MPAGIAGRAALLLLAFCLLFPANPSPAECDPVSTGSVSGTVAVSRTRVATEGPKSDKDVVVSLQPISASAPLPAGAKATMDQKGFIFIPHVLPVSTGTTVTFLNNDNEQHNVYFLFDRTGKTLDIGTWGPGQSVDYTFGEAGTAITLCKLHLEMAAYVVVLDTPFFTLAELDGSTQKGAFTIDGVTPGRYLLTAWHKKLKQLGGPVEVTVEAGENAVSDITITKAKYAK